MTAKIIVAIGVVLNVGGAVIAFIEHSYIMSIICILNLIWILLMWVMAIEINNYSSICNTYENILKRKLGVSWKDEWSEQMRIDKEKTYKEKYNK